MKRTIKAGEFKARCLHLMDEVKESRESILITKHNVPVAKLVPVAPEKPEKISKTLLKKNFVTSVVIPGPSSRITPLESRIYDIK